jgi:hypothetical protein
MEAAEAAPASVRLMKHATQGDRRMSDGEDLNAIRLRR